MCRNLALTPHHVTSWHVTASHFTSLTSLAFRLPIMTLIVALLLRPTLIRPTFLCYSFSCYSHRLYSDSKTVTPLRILFAGSNDFSAVSLNALYREHVNRPSLIASIDVLCREDGRTGRKRDILKEGTLSTPPVVPMPSLTTNISNSPDKGSCA